MGRGRRLLELLDARDALAGARLMVLPLGERVALQVPEALHAALGARSAILLLLQRALHARSALPAIDFERVNGHQGQLSFVNVPCPPQRFKVERRGCTHGLSLLSCEREKSLGGRRRPQAAHMAGASSAPPRPLLATRIFRLGSTHSDRAQKSIGPYITSFTVK